MTVHFLSSSHQLYILRFADSCQSLLVSVYDGLMLPLPPALSPATSSTSPHSHPNDIEDEEEWNHPRSLGSRPAALDTTTVNRRVFVVTYTHTHIMFGCSLFIDFLWVTSLTRYNSFQGSQTQRQIVVMKNKKCLSEVSEPHMHAHTYTYSLFFVHFLL